MRGRLPWEETRSGGGGPAAFLAAATTGGGRTGGLADEAPEKPARAGEETSAAMAISALRETRSGGREGCWRGGRRPKPSRNQNPSAEAPPSSDICSF